MTFLSRPSRSYKDVGHDADGLSAIGTTPYAMRGPSVPRQQQPPPDRLLKTFRPSYTDMHFRRQALQDPHAGSSTFAPLPSRKQKKEQAALGHRNEINHILEPGYKSTGAAARDDDAASIAGPSRLSGRTAGGFAALTGRRKDKDEVARANASTTSFQRDTKGPGVYIDSSGRMHDTEFDPFAGVAAVSRRKSKRRSAFGRDQRRGSSSSSSSSGSSVGYGQRMNTAERALLEEPEREYRRRTEAERRQLDEVSLHAAARRRSVMSDRASGFYSGRGTPSIRSGRDYDDALSLANGRAASRLSQSHLPTSPTLDEKSAVSGGSSHTTNRRSNLANSEESPRKHTETVQTSPSPQGHDRTASTSSSRLQRPIVKIAPPEPENDAEAVEEEGEEDYEEAYQPDGALEDTPEEGSEVASEEYASFDEAPPVYQETDRGITPQLRLKKSELPTLVPQPVRPKKVVNGDARHQVMLLPKAPIIVVEKRLPDTPVPSRVERAPSGATRVMGFDAGPARPMPVPQSVQKAGRLASESVFSAATSRSSEADRAEARQRPKPRPREQLFPETPAQAKKREERERRNLRAGRTRAGELAADSKPGSSSRSRILPEIEIVDDDDPRIVFPPNGPATRIQTRFDHVIRTPSGSHTTRRADDNGSSTRSVGHGSSKEPSAIIEESGGGYLPSRWASGDRHLRLTEQDKEQYRPREGGGRHGDLGGRPEEWRPSVKEGFKKEMKDMSTNARFGLFRAKKKVLRGV
ncbi:hypothetical protein CC85DRAFT_126397 [Cutaneotrichosporon oleaginosum]|uniref:Uncharacterized protein n=1 Tax=Cutaneotrichosporon oleaginosum TaxID=879819 RepID=A0A0J1B0X0_9TREE|nr:uncharacterized protein CC85DRAFT_126397 [Cutaneotrichosporon oleaginosum]KLT41254.1 hypothetical protein CC85DRAFT_126397 [Cutaneotrichosporon oleaginosum]